MKITSPNIMVSHPGKLGDLVLALPCVRDISIHFNTPVTLLISPHVRALIPLLKLQSYIKKVLVDESYAVIHEHRGYQPHTLEHDSVSHVDMYIELGYRESDEYKIESSAIRGYPYFILQKEYGIKLSGSKEPSIKIPFSSPQNPSEKYILFQGFGETLDVIFGHEKTTSLLIHWAAILKATGCSIKIFTGPRESKRYQQLGLKPIVSHSLLETTTELIGSCGFVGVQSVISTIANELGFPRLILSQFPNALPDTVNGDTIMLQDMSNSAAEKMISWVSGRVG